MQRCPMVCIRAGLPMMKGDGRVRSVAQRPAGRGDVRRQGIRTPRDRFCTRRIVRSFQAVKQVRQRDRHGRRARHNAGVLALPERAARWWFGSRRHRHDQLDRSTRRLRESVLHRLVQGRDAKHQRGDALRVGSAGARRRACTLAIEGTGQSPSIDRMGRRAAWSALAPSI